MRVRNHNAASFPSGAGGPAARRHLTIALAGNPNVGKSTLFNRLTGMRQHTGNWPGKTVVKAEGSFRHRGRRYVVVDLPGTYSLHAASADEQATRDFICLARPDIILLIADAACLERGLNLALQTLETSGQVVLCLNLMDEAQKKGVRVDTERLAQALGIPVAGISARDGRGISKLKDILDDMAGGKIITAPRRVVYDRELEALIEQVAPSIEEGSLPGGVSRRWAALRLLEAQTPPTGRDDIKDRIVSAIYREAETVCRQAIKTPVIKSGGLPQAKLDRLLASRRFGFPLMLLLLTFILWLTMIGANYPSRLLADALFRIEDGLAGLFMLWGAPSWLRGVLVLGMYRTLAWVISVMLPPMAIFFPLFTLLEDLGYLPRVAFNLDNLFRRAGAHGKQCLTMCMGFGCNAAGVTSCRIIDSPRERLIAVLTNAFSVCNGRFPTLILLATVFIAPLAPTAYGSAVAALTVAGVITAGILIALFVSYLLSRTLLRGAPSFFLLELPPFRPPQLGQIIIRSLLDRTLFVLGRAVLIAAPAGALTWALANLSAGGLSLLARLTGCLNPPGQLMGMDGTILTAFLLGLPANEIILPLIVMGYTSAGSLLEPGGISALRALLLAHGWTWLTALCVMTLSLLHLPCGTTLYTIYKETRDVRWTTIAALLPLILGILATILINQIGHNIALVCKP